MEKVLKENEKLLEQNMDLKDRVISQSEIIYHILTDKRVLTKGFCRITQHDYQTFTQICEYMTEKDKTQLAMAELSKNVLGHTDYLATQTLLLNLRAMGFVDLEIVKDDVVITTVNPTVFFLRKKLKK